MTLINNYCIKSHWNNNKTNVKKREVIIIFIGRKLYNGFDILYCQLLENQ